MGENKVNLDLVKAELRKAQSKADKRGIKWLKLRDGENLVRILPPWSADGMFCKEGGYHYGVDGDTALACPKVCKNQPCPVCEAAGELFKTRGKSASEAIGQAKRIGVKVRYFANVLDRIAKDKVVYVLGFGPMVYEQILGIFGDKDYGDITDIENGYDVKIIRAGEGLNTTYTVRPAKEASKVINWETKKAQLADLDAIVDADLKTYKQLKAILEGTTESEEESEEEPVKEEESESEKEETPKAEEQEEEVEEKPAEQEEEEPAKEEEQEDARPEKMREETQKALAHLKTLRKKPVK